MDSDGALSSFDLPLTEFGATDIAETKIVWFDGNGDEPATPTATNEDESPTATADNDSENVAETRLKQSSLINVGSVTDEIFSEQSPCVLNSTNSNGRFDISRAQLSNRTPVFDRFTWIALGRDVPSGSNSVVSITRTKQLMLADFGMLPMRQRIAVTAVAGCSQRYTSIDQISITQTDDSTLMDELLRSSSGEDSGSYFVICRGGADVDRAPEVCTTTIEARVTPDVSDAKTHSPLSTELISARKIIGDSDAFAESQAESKASRAMQSQTDAPPASHLRIWQDGMLVFSGHPGRDTENASESLFENRKAIIIEPDDNEPTDVHVVEQTTAQQTTDSQNSITLGPGGFFTLPVSDQNHDDDLETIEISQHEDVFPFVEAINNLRVDVRGFQNSRAVPGADSVAAPRPATPASERVSPSEDVISQAKSRLDHHETLTDSTASALQMAPELHRPQSSSNAIESVSMAEAAINGDKTSQFSRLFTRLWENRKRTTDQFEKR